MSCGCSPTSVSGNPWAAPAGKPILAVYDAVTGNLRPLAFGEAAPIPDCGAGCAQQSFVPTPKNIQDAYFDLMRRLTLLEQKYCQCVGNVTPAPVIDSWQSDVIELLQAPAET